LRWNGQRFVADLNVSASADADLQSNSGDLEVQISTLYPAAGSRQSIQQQGSAG
jgi:hypothetical protein